MWPVQLRYWLLPGKEIEHELDHGCEDITPAAPSCPLAFLDDLIKWLLDDLIRWLLRLPCLLPLRGRLRLDWFRYHKQTIVATQLGR